jgi:hypothetical protein
MTMADVPDKLDAMIQATKDFTEELVKLNGTQYEQLDELKKLNTKTDTLEAKFSNGFKAEILSAMRSGQEKWRTQQVMVWIAILGSLGTIGVLVGVIVSLLPKT